MNVNSRLGSLLNSKRLNYAWIASGALWLGWLASILFGPGKIDLAGQVIGTDYLEFYTAGVTLRLGESARLYDMHYQSQLQQALIDPGLHSYYAFITPPFMAWLFLPLTALPYLWSFALWSLLGLLGLWVSLRLLGVGNVWRSFAWSLTWFPVFAAVSFGQNSLLSLLLLSLIYRLWRRGHGLAAGFTASLLLYKPQLLLGVALLWLLEWLWPALNELLSGATKGENVGQVGNLSYKPIYRAVVHAALDATAHENGASGLEPLGGLVGTRPAKASIPVPQQGIFRAGLLALLGLSVGGGLLVALCFWQLPEASHAYVVFARTILPNLPAYQEFPLWHLHTVWGFWRLLLPGASAWADRLYWVFTVAGIGGFICTWRRLQGRGALLFAAAICLTLWATPHAMIYDWALLLIPAAVLWQEAPELTKSWKALYALIWLVSFISGPLTRLQLRWLPFAVQVSVPVLLVGIYVVFHRLVDLSRPHSSHEMLPGGGW